MASCRWNLRCWQDSIATDGPATAGKEESVSASRTTSTRCPGHRICCEIYVSATYSPLYYFQFYPTLYFCLPLPLFFCTISALRCLSDALCSENDDSTCVDDAFISTPDAAGSRAASTEADYTPQWATLIIIHPRSHYHHRLELVGLSSQPPCRKYRSMIQKEQ